MISLCFATLCLNSAYSKRTLCYDKLNMFSLSKEAPFKLSVHRSLTPTLGRGPARFAGRRINFAILRSSFWDFFRRLFCMFFRLSSTASGYCGASLPFSASLAPFWLQPGSFGCSLGTLGVSLGSLFGISWALLPLLASPGSLLGLFWGALEPLKVRPGALLEGDRSWNTFSALLSYFLDLKSNPKIRFVCSNYGSLF